MEILTQRIQWISLTALLLGLSLSLSGTPSIAGMPEAERFTGQLEISACAILDEQALPEFNLSQEQQSAWLRLRQEHQILRGESCQTMPGADIQRISGTSAVAQKIEDTSLHAETMQAYQKHLLGFLMSLSEEQQALLNETICARRKTAEDLHEKVILHSLML
ncbi:MAG TPA: hypothetical protein PLI90_07285 [Rhodocyclaceae bacterium]|nr:hypothetical protein [Rhodocyclaceae bacterium]